LKESRVIDTFCEGVPFTLNSIILVEYFKVVLPALGIMPVFDALLFNILLHWDENKYVATSETYGLHCLIRYLKGGARKRNSRKIPMNQQKG
jgi:hypothetical protein